MARKVRAFGDVESLGDQPLRASDPFLAYVELENWPFVAGIGDQVRAHARYTIAIFDAQGTSIMREGPFDATQVSQAPVANLYVTRMVRLPATIAPGSYRLILDATDMATGVQSTVSLPFEVQPAAKR